jgi:hypothetical protein
MFFFALVYFYATIRVRDIVCKLHVQQYSSYMVTVSFIVGGNRRKSCWPAVISIIYNVIYIEHTSPWTGIKLTTLVVKCTDCVFGKCKFNYRHPASNRHPTLKSMYDLYITDIGTSDLCSFINFSNRRPILK